jgi:hypothetical protein
MGLSISSGLINATPATQISTGKSILSGVTVITDNTNPATITVYDNGSGTASGNVLAKLSATVTTGANSLAFVTPIRADLGIVVSVTGTGSPQGIIYYGS